MMSVEKKIKDFQNKLKQTDCKLIAVSKTYPASFIQEAYDAGQRDFGENKVQELIEKQPHLPQDIRWHLIGHLQRNKVKYIAPFIHLIHSVDSEKLLKEIQKQAAKEERIIQCLLQVHIAEEESKFGLAEEELRDLLKGDILRKAKNVNVIGLMGMATFTENIQQVRKEFRKLKQIFEDLQRTDLPENVMMQELSMGMSGDYEIAIEEGSTMIRVGSAIFGARNYQQ